MLRTLFRTAVVLAALATATFVAPTAAFADPPLNPYNCRAWLVHTQHMDGGAGRCEGNQGYFTVLVRCRNAAGTAYQTFSSPNVPAGSTRTVWCPYSLPIPVWANVAVVG